MLLVLHVGTTGVQLPLVAHSLIGEPDSEYPDLQEKEAMVPT